MITPGTIVCRRHPPIRLGRVRATTPGGSMLVVMFADRPRVMWAKNVRLATTPEIEAFMADRAIVAGMGRLVDHEALAKLRASLDNSAPKL